MNLTVGEIKKLIQDLPDESLICYHGYYKGCNLSAYQLQDVWLFPVGEKAKNLVLNPGENYDPRKAKKV